MVEHERPPVYLRSSCGWSSILPRGEDVWLGRGRPPISKDDNLLVSRKHVCVRLRSNEDIADVTVAGRNGMVVRPMSSDGTGPREKFPAIVGTSYPIAVNEGCFYIHLSQTQLLKFGLRHSAKSPKKRRQSAGNQKLEDFVDCAPEAGAREVMQVIRDEPVPVRDGPDPITEDVSAQMGNNHAQIGHNQAQARGYSQAHVIADSRVQVESAISHPIQESKQEIRNPAKEILAERSSANENRVEENLVEGNPAEGIEEDPVKQANQNSKKVVNEVEAIGPVPENLIQVIESNPIQCNSQGVNNPIPFDGTQGLQDQRDDDSEQAFSRNYPSRIRAGHSQAEVQFHGVATKSGFPFSMLYNPEDTVEEGKVVTPPRSEQGPGQQPNPHIIALGTTDVGKLQLENKVEVKNFVLDSMSLHRSLSRTISGANSLPNQHDPLIPHDYNISRVLDPTVQEISDPATKLVAPEITFLSTTEARSAATESIGLPQWSVDWYPPKTRTHIRTPPKKASTTAQPAFPFTNPQDLSAVGVQSSFAASKPVSPSPLPSCQERSLDDQGHPSRVLSTSTSSISSVLSITAVAPSLQRTASAIRTNTPPSGFPTANAYPATTSVNNLAVNIQHLSKMDTRTATGQAQGSPRTHNTTQTALGDVQLQNNAQAQGSFQAQNNMHTTHNEVQAAQNKVQPAQSDVQAQDNAQSIQNKFQAQDGRQVQAHNVQNAQDSVQVQNSAQGYNTQDLSDGLAQNTVPIGSAQVGSAQSAQVSSANAQEGVIDLTDSQQSFHDPATWSSAEEVPLKQESISPSKHARNDYDDTLFQSKRPRRKLSLGISRIRNRTEASGQPEPTGNGPASDEASRPEGWYTLAFPSLSTDPMEFMFDVDVAVDIAGNAIKEFLSQYLHPQIRLIMVVPPPAYSLGSEGKARRVSVVEKEEEIVQKMKQLPAFVQDSRFTVRVGDLTQLRSSVGPCAFLANSCNWRFKGQGGGVNRVVNLASGPSLETLSLMGYHTATAGKAYAVPLPEGDSRCSLLSQGVKWVLQVMGPNMNPERPDRQPSYQEAGPLLGKAYTNLFSLFYHLTGLQPAISPAPFVFDFSSKSSRILAVLRPRETTRPSSFPISVSTSSTFTSPTATHTTKSRVSPPNGTNPPTSRASSVPGVSEPTKSATAASSSVFPFTQCLQMTVHYNSLLEIRFPASLSTISRQGPGKPSGPTLFSHPIAAFDFEGTLITTKSGRDVPQNSSDWRFFDDSVPQKLTSLYKRGYNLLIITNLWDTFGKSPNLTDLKQRVIDVLNALDLPLIVLGSLQNDHYQLPSPRIWNYLTGIFPRENPSGSDIGANDQTDLQASGAVLVSEEDLWGDGSLRQPTTTTTTTTSTDAKQSSKPDNKNKNNKASDGESSSNLTSFYVGDAADRPAGGRAASGSLGGEGKKDRSAVDRIFAANVGLKFYTPEEFFLGHRPAPYNADSLDATALLATIDRERETRQQRTGSSTYLGIRTHSTPHGPSTTVPKPSTFAMPFQEMIIFLGPPASGKTTFFETHLRPAGYALVSRDIVNSQAKCIQLCKQLISRKKSICVDNTNPSREKREVYIRVAKAADIPVRCMHFVAAPTLVQHLNKYRQFKGERNGIPTLAYANYHKHFEPPVPSEGFNEIWEYDVRWALSFASPHDRGLFLLNS